MDMFLYIDKDTYLHRLDPRTKLFIMLSTFAIALIFYSIPVLIGAYCVVLLYGHTGKVLSNLKRIRVILFMIALGSVVIWSLMKGGDAQIIGPITQEGVIYGILTAIRFNVIIVAGMIFLSSTKIEEISSALVKLKIPYRGAFAFSTAIRLVPTIVGTSYTIMQAQKSRGLDLESGSITERIRKYIPLVIPVFTSVIRGTNIFTMALESKGFNYADTRTSYLDIKFSAMDYIVLFLTLTITLFSIYASIKLV